MMMKRLLWLLLLIAALSVSPLWAQNGQNGVSSHDDLPQRIRFI